MTDKAEQENIFKTTNLIFDLGTSNNIEHWLMLKAAGYYYVAMSVVLKVSKDDFSSELKHMTKVFEDCI